MLQITQSTIGASQSQKAADLILGVTRSDVSQQAVG